jgi:hypothetical protein
VFRSPVPVARGPAPPAMLVGGDITKVSGPAKARGGALAAVGRIGMRKSPPQGFNSSLPHAVPRRGL